MMMNSLKSTSPPPVTSAASNIERIRVSEYSFPVLAPSLRMPAANES